MNKISVYQSAANSKTAGYNKYYAWDMYIKDTGLKPEVDAKEFYAIYEKISPAVATKKPTIKATHHDTFFDVDCEINIDKHGVWDIVWAFGMTGGYPPCNPPEEGRFVPLEAD